MERPLILVTNDDGIDSPGLWSVAEAVLPLGEVLIVAPDRQWSGGGRSMPPNVSGRYRDASREVAGEHVTAYAVDASPALTVQHAILEFAPRRPSLVVSGANFGLNMTTEVTISGTVGAALEASSFGIPALAVSLEMGTEHHLTGKTDADYAATKAYTQRFAWYQLIYAPIHDVDVLSLNIPSDATPRTPWRLTRLSRRRYFVPQAPDRANGVNRPGYKVLDDMSHIELNSDVWALKVERIVSVTPLSLDITSRTNLYDTNVAMRSEVASCRDALDMLSLFSHDPAQIAPSCAQPNIEEALARQA
jgi:5'-nucleotidase